MQLIRHHGTRNYDVSVSEVPKSTRTGTVLRKLESEGKQGSNCITPRLGKRSRPFKWQRRSYKKQKQSSPEENSLNTHCNVLPTNKDCMRATSLPNTTSLSYHAKVINCFSFVLKFWSALDSFLCQACILQMLHKFVVCVNPKY